ncbi:MAG: hypothetical protein OEZ23_09625 [Gammaproteobacteria bacterium]|nr:hypothetical protein [Gammaproteobacteria bacterium]
MDHDTAAEVAIRMLDIEIYDPEKNTWAQGRYLAHSHDDVLWTDDLEAALSFLRESAHPEND